MDMKLFPLLDIAPIQLKKVMMPRNRPTLTNTLVKFRKNNMKRLLTGEFIRTVTQHGFATQTVPDFDLKIPWAINDQESMDGAAPQKGRGLSLEPELPRTLHFMSKGDNGPPSLSSDVYSLDLSLEPQGDLLARMIAHHLLSTSNIPLRLATLENWLQAVGALQVFVTRKRTAQGVSNCESLFLFANPTHPQETMNIFPL
jgi:hypothetical protein